MAKMKVTKSMVGIFLLCTVALAACGVDVGGNDDQFTVAVRNNTSETVTLGACEDTCGSFAGTWVIRTGQSASTGQDPDGVFRPMEVLSSSRVLLGCLPFKFSKTPPSGRFVDVSQMVRCGKSAGAEASGGRDWPFSHY
jgi:hypothetical protein